MRAETHVQPRLSALAVITRKPVKVVCGCTGCRFVASALDEGRALRSWAAHRVRMHQMGGHREDVRSN